MVAGTVAFLLGVTLLQAMAVLPPATWLLVPLLLSASLFVLPVSRRYLAWPVACAVAGFLWAWLTASLQLQQRLPAQLEGRDLLVEGVVCSLPEADTEQVRFLFDVERTQGPDGTAFGGKVRLTGYAPFPAIEAGQRWQLRVRLKRPHGMADPGAFDYERWLYQQGIVATGYVRGAGGAVLLTAQSGRYRLQHLRQWWREEIERQLGAEPLAGVVLALALGDTQGISRDQWRLLRRTGTNHLVAISGLHIGIVAGFVFFLGRLLWARWPAACQRWPAPKAAALLALTAALGYAALAGFSIPTRRALVMLAVAMGAVVGQRAVRPVRLLALALLLVILGDPLAALAPGFWLSFAAVALIVFGMGGRVGGGGWWWRLGRPQLLVALGLAPLLAVWFQQVPVVGVVANLAAVPWVTLVTVPLTLLGTLLTPWWPAAAGWLLHLAIVTLQGLWWWLEWTAALAPSGWGVMAPPAWTLLPAAVGIVWLLLPRGWPARWLGIPWLLPLLLVHPPAPPMGEVWVTQLDVGQGSAVVVRTASHTLLFDTGPRFGPELDAGEAVVVPFLRQQGIGYVDAMVLSHGDSDHIGGTASVLAAVPAGRILSGVAKPRPWPGSAPCRRGMQWLWDRVVFQLLGPPLGPAADASENNGSCVLRVVTPTGAALLTGDIEAEAEAELVATYGDRLQAAVLVAPHHGSKSSSTPSFVAAVRPHLVLFSVGYRNRFHFPHSPVAARYGAAGAALLESADHGAITVRLGAAGTAVESYRTVAHRYWFAD